jgi:tRNA A-37 threonylcarbamoyl transferase component Bud32
MPGSIIKKLYGHSGCQVYLMQDNDKPFVRKIGNIERNLSKLKELQNEVNVPAIYASGDTFIDMEYVHGIDLRQYLIEHDPDILLEFLIRLGKKFTTSTTHKNYTESVDNFLASINFECLPFTKQQLTAKLELDLWSSNYHGDLTLENIIYSKNKFVLIDCSTGIWDSWLFDLIKLRQDLDCHWFMRTNHAMIENKLTYLKGNLEKQWPELNNDYLLILMLLRVYRHCNLIEDANFILGKIKLLWK